MFPTSPILTLDRSRPLYAPLLRTSSPTSCPRCRPAIPAPPRTRRPATALRTAEMQGSAAHAGGNAQQQQLAPGAQKDEDGLSCSLISVPFSGGRLDRRPWSAGADSRCSFGKCIPFPSSRSCLHDKMRERRRSLLEGKIQHIRHTPI